MIMETRPGREDWLSHELVLLLALSTWLGRTRLGQRKRRDLPCCVDFVKNALACGRCWLLRLLASGLPSLFSFASLFPHCCFFCTSFILPHDSPFIPHLPNNCLGPFRNHHIEWNEIESKPHTPNLGMPWRQYVKHSGREALVILDLSAGESFSLTTGVEENRSKSNIKRDNLHQPPVHSK